MKAKLYAISLFTGILMSVGASATCNVTFTYTLNGLTINVTANGTGANVPYYAWTWGDAGVGNGQTASHTYSTAGTYTVCVGYVDLSDTSCHAVSCQTVVVSASGIADNSRPQMDIKANPNPFSTSTSILVTLSQPMKVNISVFDLTGQKVAVIHDGMLGAGQQTINWRPDGMAEGIYFLQIRAGDIIQTRKIVFNSAN